MCATQTPVALYWSGNADMSVFVFVFVHRLSKTPNLTFFFDSHFKMKSEDMLSSPHSLQEQHV